MHSSLFLNLIVTNHEDEEMTTAFVMIRPEIRKYTSWPRWNFSFTITPSLYRTCVHYNIKVLV